MIGKSSLWFQRTICFRNKLSFLYVLVTFFVRLRRIVWEGRAMLRVFLFLISGALNIKGHCVHSYKRQCVVNLTSYIKILCDKGYSRRRASNGIMDKTNEEQVLNWQRLNGKTLMMTVHNATSRMILCHLGFT